MIINRRVSQRDSQSDIQYSSLIQCKRVDVDGRLGDFYHEVGVGKKTQSSLMLDITPSSFYFIFTPSCLLDVYYSLTPTAFIRDRECSSQIWSMEQWNITRLGYGGLCFPFLSDSQIDSASGVLVVPALSVEAQNNKSKDAKLSDILPNCMPFWYWFSEMLATGFIGDTRKEVIHTAANDTDFSIQIDVGSG